ncbi:unnamed protein product [Peniophora sp. CBMAI 1063]|nr:unnamed protein product [Peniophora sp. CBMAI 1063]
MAAGLKKGRNRLSLMLSFGSTHDSSKNRSTSTQISSMGSIDAFGLSSTTSLPVTPSHITPSPRSPLLSSPAPRSPHAMETPAPLPTVNDLGAQEKTRLLKQARKISQIFGEMPSMKEEDLQSNYRPSRDDVRPVQRPTRSSSLMPTGNRLHRPAPRTRSRPTLNVRPTSPSLAAPTPQAAPPVPEIPASASSTPSTTPGFIAPPLAPDITSPTPRRSFDARSERSARSMKSVKTKLPTPALPADPNSRSEVQVLVQGDTGQLTRSNSARSVAVKRRGRSMEDARPDPRPRVSATARPSTASSAKRPSTAPREETSHRRARSLRENKVKLKGSGQREDVKSDRDAVIRDLKENSHFGDSQRMTRTQRSLSIKRARKLNHMFGSEPPQALYVSSFVEKRLSGATIYSISSSADLLSVQNPATRAAKHHSITSVSTTSEPSSPIATVHDIPPMKGHRRHPSTPAAPIVEALASGAHGEEDDLSPVEPKEAFRQRRMRAAKLSRFFGVDLHDLSQSLEPTPSTPRPSVATAQADPPPPKMPQREPSLDGVDVRIQAPAGKFWSRHDHRREVDMNDVINRLREMR